MAAENIMSVGEMRPVLALAKAGTPVGCAVAFTKDRDGLMLVDRKLPPKKALAGLRKKAAGEKLVLDAASLRFGWATVAAEDTATLLIKVNKPASAALRAGLMETVKKCGFSKLEFQIDESIENEPEEEGEGEDEAPAQTEQTAAPEVAKSEPPKDKPRAGIVEFQKSRLIWVAARKKVATEINAFKAAIAEEFEGDPDEPQALAAIDELDEVLLNFDDTLVDQLDDLLNASDDATKAKLSGDVKKTIGGYIVYLQSNPLVAKLEGDTPFGVKLSVGSTLLNTLKVLGTQLR